MVPSDPPPTPNEPTSEASGPERRVHERAPIGLRVEYKRLNSFFADYTRNISKGGTFIATRKPLPIGTPFVFSLGIPGLEAPLELEGTVTWIVQENEATAEQPAGMGIRFEYRDEAHRQRIQQLIEKLITDSLGPVVGARLLEHARNQPDKPR